MPVFSLDNIELMFYIGDGGPLAPLLVGSEAPKAPALFGLALLSQTIDARFFA